MLRNTILAGFAFVLAISAMTQQAEAQGPRSRIAQWGSPYTVTDYQARNFAAGQPWHGNYYYLPYGQPTALVVPQVAGMQTVHSWGVSQNTMHPIYHQYGRQTPVYGGGAFYATPTWPAHSSQFGVYPVRAPW